MAKNKSNDLIKIVIAILIFAGAVLLFNILSNEQIIELINEAINKTIQLLFNIIAIAVIVIIVVILIKVSQKDRDEW